MHAVRAVSLIDYLTTEIRAGSVVVRNFHISCDRQWRNVEVWLTDGRRVHFRTTADRLTTRFMWSLLQQRSPTHSGIRRMCSREDSVTEILPAEGSDMVDEKSVSDDRDRAEMSRRARHAATSATAARLFGWTVFWVIACVFVQMCR